jgi:hypothetical protein
VFIFPSSSCVNGLSATINLFAFKSVPPGLDRSFHAQDILLRLRAVVAARERSLELLDFIGQVRRREHLEVAVDLGVDTLLVTGRAEPPALA